MNRKHWHLTTDPFNRADFGGRISIRKYADQLAKATRRRSSRPIYVETCTADCGPAGQPLTIPDGRPLIEVLADEADGEREDARLP